MPMPVLAEARTASLGVQADDVLDLFRHPVRVGRRQVDLVQHRDHLDAEVDRGVAVGHRLRFHALRGIDHQQRAFAGGQRARHFVGKVDVAGGIDQVQAVDLAVLRLVGERGGLRLDGDAALLFQVHGIEHLRLHLALGQAAAKLDQAVGQRGLAVVDVGDDGEIADQILRHNKTGTFPCPARDEITTQNFNGFQGLKAQPFLKRRQIKLMAANLGVAVEQQRHVPAIACLERRIGIHIHRAPGDAPVSPRISCAALACPPCSSHSGQPARV